MKILLIRLILLLCLLGWVGCNSSEDDMINASDPAMDDEEETDEDFIGLSTQQAETRAFRRNIPFRYLQIDGEPQVVTLDFSPDRLNFTVERDVVIGVSRG